MFSQRNSPLSTSVQYANGSKSLFRLKCDDSIQFEMAIRKIRDFTKNHDSDSEDNVS